ncbi:MAG TPA: glycosyltransferase family 87 protein [Gemmataceae bacterium]|nr:glycosyltransferase family 87 protein [Gemmataceae bacterium]
MVGVRTVVSPATHTVFPIFALSGEHWWADQSLYAEYKPLDHFRYPPVFAVAVTPFSLLGPRAGGVLWSWAGIAVLLAGLWRFGRDVLPRDWGPGRLALFLALGAAGALRGLWNAQSNALVVGLLLLGAAAVARRRWWAAAFLLAGSVWVKLTPLAPALLLCALWPRRLTGRFAVALAVGGLLPFLTRPPEIVLGHYREWVGHLLGSGSERWPGFRDGWTVWLVLRHLAEGATGPLPVRAPIDSSFYRAVQLLSAGAALAWCLWQRRQGAPRRWLVKVTLGMGLAWLMLFGPAVEHATYVFLTPALAAAFLERGAWPRGRGLIVAAFVLVMVLGWGAVARLLPDRLPVLLAALPVGTALYAAWLVGYAAACVPGRPSVPASGMQGRLNWSGPLPHRRIHSLYAHQSLQEE